jgi:hypothetical protein
MSNPMPGRDCAQFAERLAALAVDGDADFERHAAECADCRREAERFRGLISRLRGDEAAASADEPAPVELHDGILRAIAAAVSSAPTRSSRRRWRWRWPMLAAGLAAAAGLAWMMLARHPRPIAKRHGAPPAALAPFDDEDDPCQLIGDLDDDEVARASRHFKGGA